MIDRIKMRSNVVLKQNPNGPEEQDSCGDCLGRIPYASLLSFLVLSTGVGLFCAFGYQAVNASVRQMGDVLGLSVPVTDNLRLGFILVGVLMALISVILLVIGILATGGTRLQVYDGWKSRLGGRISCGVFLGLSYLLNLLWLFVFSVTGAMAFVYYVLNSFCPHQVVSGNNGQCVNLTLFSQAFSSVGGNPANLNLCGTNLQKFCTLTETAWPWYTVAYAAGAAIVLGLIHFMICLAANYAHIKEGHKYLELAEIRSDEQDYNELGSFQVKPTAGRKF